MQFGLHSINLHSCGYPETAAVLARTAEAAGFDSLWVADHVVLSDPPLPQRPMAPEMRLLDPIVLAKQLATLDMLSHGRVLFGIGVGWCEPEFHALGIPFAQRGRMGD